MMILTPSWATCRNHCRRDCQWQPTFPKHYHLSAKDQNRRKRLFRCIHMGKPALEINTKIENTHATALNSPPDSPFNIKCRCGLKGDGNVYYDEMAGEAVLCTECEHWSHIACQRNGRASKLRAKEAFFCDICQVQAPGMGKSEKERASERRCVVFYTIY